MTRRPLCLAQSIDGRLSTMPLNLPLTDIVTWLNQRIIPANYHTLKCRLC
jgi:hypothetical protein